MAKNRRVEFKILEQEGVERTEGPPATTPVDEVVEEEPVAGEEGETGEQNPQKEEPEGEE